MMLFLSMENETMKTVDMLVDLAALAFAVLMLAGAAR